STKSRNFRSENSYVLLPLLLGVALDGGFVASEPRTWHLSARLAKDGPQREKLIADFTAPDGGVGEQPLTPEEANALLDDPRAEQVYGEKTVSIVAPSMLQRQRKDHLELMKMFLTPERLEAGARFAREYQTVLAAVEAKTEVSREVIIAILMWE